MSIDAALPVSPDRPAKVRRLVDILEAEGADALRLVTPTSLSWLFDGARASVPTGGGAVFSARVDRAGEVTVSAPRNEADRLAAEELGGCLIDVVDWYAPFAAPRGDELAEAAVAAELRTARRSLLPDERRKYRALGRDAAAAMTAALRQADPRMSEHALAGTIARELRARGCEPSVTLVAGASRSRVQHPLPTGAELGARALGVATAVRDGLFLSVSRWVRFAPRPAAQAAAQAAVREVEADAWAATRPGRPLDRVLADIGSAYARHGLDRDGDSGWRLHHQGGPTGYAGRDPKVGPGERGTVADAQAFAWNPWAPGAKAEDTVLVSGDDIEVLSVDPDWPTVPVRGRPRPDDLDLS